MQAATSGRTFLVKTVLETAPLIHHMVWPRGSGEILIDQHAPVPGSGSANPLLISPALVNIPRTPTHVVDTRPALVVLPHRPGHLDLMIIINGVPLHATDTGPMQNPNPRHPDRGLLPRPHPVTW